MHMKPNPHKYTHFWPITYLKYVSLHTYSPVFANVRVICMYCVCSVWVAPVAAPPGYPGFAGLSDHSPIPAQEEEAERQPDQPEDPEGEPKSGQRDRHRGPEQRKCVLLSLLALQNCKLFIVWPLSACMEISLLVWKALRLRCSDS